MVGGGGVIFKMRIIVIKYEKHNTIWQMCVILCIVCMCACMRVCVRHEACWHNLCSTCRPHTRWVDSCANSLQWSPAVSRQQESEVYQQLTCARPLGAILQIPHALFYDSTFFLSIRWKQHFHSDNYNNDELMMMTILHRKLQIVTVLNTCPIASKHKHIFFILPMIKTGSAQVK